MATERQRITTDLDSLLPGDTIKIGTQVLDIKPLGLLKLSMVARKIKGFGGILQESGVTWDNYNEPANLLQLAVVLLEQFPEVLEEASNIAIEDLRELPIEIVVELLDKVIDVNMKSKDKLEKNFKSLAKKFSMIQTEKKKSQKPSKS